MRPRFESSLTAAPIQFWFDFSCPYAYIASTRRRWLADVTGRTVEPRPMLLGGVFQAIGQVQNLASVLSPPKARHNRLDVLRQAALAGAALHSPVRHPNRTVLALRCVLAAPPAACDAVIDAFFAAYWAEGADIADGSTLRGRLQQLQLDADAILHAAETPAIKDELRRQTDEAVALGIFGAPTFVVDRRLFWGADRVDMVALAAHGWHPEAGRDDFQF